MFIHGNVVNANEIFRLGAFKHTAVGAFNFSNMEILQAIVEAANDEEVPCIIQVTESAIKYMGMRYLVHMAIAAAESSDVPLCLHLDHGSSFEVCAACIDSGFSSVMIDRSSLSFEENVAETNRVVEYARKFNVSVEAELGTLAGVEDHVSNDSSLFTDPEMARVFVEETGVDSLAVAIGTSHGPNKGKNPKLDIERLTKIREAIGIGSFPFVLHGASSIYRDIVDSCNFVGMALGLEIKNTSGIAESDIKAAIRAGIAKINVDSDIRLAFLGGVLLGIKQNSSSIDSRKFLKFAKDAAKTVVKRRLSSFSCL
jgi:fructose-bisphosphate aldolase class II